MSGKGQCNAQRKGKDQPENRQHQQYRQAVPAFWLNIFQARHATTHQNGKPDGKADPKPCQTPVLPARYHRNNNPCYQQQAGNQWTPLVFPRISAKQDKPVLFDKKRPARSGSLRTGGLIPPRGNRLKKQPVNRDPAKGDNHRNQDQGQHAVAHGSEQSFAPYGHRADDRGGNVSGPESLFHDQVLTIWPRAL